MFAYCNNNPVNAIDPTGEVAQFFNSINKIINWMKSIIMLIPNMIYSYSYIIKNNINKVITIQKGEFYSNTGAYSISIDLTKNFGTKTFAEYIYEEYVTVGETVFENLTKKAIEKFEKEQNRAFLFSDDCVEYEIAEHIKAYWWATNFITNKCLLVYLSQAYCTVTNRNLIDYIKTACKTVDIREEDPVYEKSSFGIRKQNEIFSYFDCIRTNIDKRKNYMYTTKDPFYDPIGKCRYKEFAQTNIYWSMK